MNQETCVHCQQLINEQPHYYPQSRTWACLSCVSQPSAAAMDLLILERKRAQ